MYRYVTFPLVFLAIATVSIAIPYKWSWAQDRPAAPIAPPPPAERPQPPGPGVPSLNRFFPDPARPAQPADPRLAELTDRYNKLEQKIFALARDFRAAREDGERERIRGEIGTVTTEQFDLRNRARKMEVERLERHLGEVQARLEKREAMKQEIIDRRVAELTDGNKELEWEPLGLPGAGPQYFDRAMQTYRSALQYGTQWPQPNSSLQLQPGAPLGQPLFPPGPKDAAGIYGAPRPNLPELAPRPDREMPGVRTSIAEARMRLDIAQRLLDRVSVLADAGTVTTEELARAKDTRQLAQVALDNLMRYHESEVKLLELDLRQAEFGLQSAQRELESLENTLRQSPDAVPAVDVARARAAIEQKQVELERARAKLDFETRQADEPRPEREPEPRR